MTLIQNIARRASEAMGRESQTIRRLRPVYESLLEWTSGGQGIPWLINGISYRINPHYRHQLGPNYDAPVAAFISEQIQPGAVCFDVGANIGVYVLQFAYWSRPLGQVIAFEPNPGARKVLNEHIRLNGLTERVKVAPVAVGCERKEATLYAVDADGMSRLGAPNKLIANRVHEIRVPVIALDDYCKAEGVIPDWLFIDIEGFEIAALSGARDLVKSRARDLKILVEFHPDVWESANTSRSAAEAMLGELGLSVIPLTGQTDPLNEHGIVYLTKR